jgi:hypothetical protein
LRRFFIMVMSHDLARSRTYQSAHCGSMRRELPRLPSRPAKTGRFDAASAVQACASNVVVIGLVGWSRRIAHNGAESPAVLSTLIEACASNGRGLAISNEEQSDV